MNALWVRFLALAGAVILAVFLGLWAVLLLFVLGIAAWLIREGFCAERQGGASGGRHRRGGAA